MTRDVPTVIDLFSGAGGFSLGFHAAGCHILAAVDKDENAGRTFLENFKELQEVPPRVLAGPDGDLERVDLRSMVMKRRPTILIGGPPCQGFSRIGRAKLNDLTEEGFAADARNELYKRFLDAAKLWDPDAVVMENVPGMLCVDGRSVADEAAADLSALGYRVGYAALNAAWYGVPQFRERLFFVAIKKKLGITPSLPPTTHHVEVPSGYVAPKRELFLPFLDLHHELDIDSTGAALDATTVRDAIGDLPLIKEHLRGDTPPRGDFRKLRKYRRKARTPYQLLMRRWRGFTHPIGVDDQATRRTPRDYETFKRMRPGDRYAEAIRIARERLAEDLARRSAAPGQGTSEYSELERQFVPPYPEDKFPDKWRKLMPDQPSWTVPAHLAKDGYSHIHYDDAQARSISVREAARLQSFPDAFRFSGNMGDCFRQIGNAVPPLMAWAVAAHLLDTLGYDQNPPWTGETAGGGSHEPYVARARVRRRAAARW